MRGGGLSVLVMGAAAMLAAAPAWGQVSDAQAARDRGAAAMAERRWADAEAAYEEALTLTRAETPGTDAVGEALYALAYARSRTPGDDAWGLWAEALAVFEANQNWARAAAAAGAAAIDHGNGSDWPEALRLARLAVTHADRSGDPAAQGQARRALGLSLVEQGDYAEAETVLVQALAQLGGPDADAAAPVLDELGLVYQETHRYDRAGTVLAQAVALKERLYGADAYPVAISLNALGALRDAQGRFDDAERLHRRALKIAEAQGRAAAAAAIRSNLGRVIHQQGRAAEAEPILRQAAEEVEAMLGAEHEDTAGAWANLAGALQDMERHAEAAMVLGDALGRYERSIGADHVQSAWTVNALARSTAALQGPAAAEPLYVRALTLSEARLSPAHPDRVRRANDVAENRLDTGRDDEAMVLIRQTGEAVRSRLDAARQGGESVPALDRGRRVFGLQVRTAWTLAGQ